jgi:hypothetical protein
MPSNLFFISIFTLILLIIIFYVIDFFLILSFGIWFVGDWALRFFHLSCFESNDTGNEFIKLIWFNIFFFLFFYNFIILHFFFLKKTLVLWVTINFLFIGLPRSYGPSLKFCRPFLNRGFFKKKNYFLCF